MAWAIPPGNKSHGTRNAQRAGPRVGGNHRGECGGAFGGMNVTLDTPCSAIGELPPTWRLRTLKGLTTKIGSGATPRGGSEVYLRERASHALIRSQHVFDRSFDNSGLAFISDTAAHDLRNAEVRPNDILLNITGDGVTFARACLVPKAILPVFADRPALCSRRPPPGTARPTPRPRGFRCRFLAG